VEQQLQSQNSPSDTFVAPWLTWRTIVRRCAVVGGYAFVAAMVALSAIIVKEHQHAPALARVQHLTAEDAELAADLPEIDDPLNAEPSEIDSKLDAGAMLTTVAHATTPSTEAADIFGEPAWKSDPSIRYFNGRPVRPARTIRMVVTAYSPDARSCDDSADGITATLHSVETNGHALVAADPRILKYGSLLTVPGYDQDRIVPVLDCGGKIKGRRLDVLYPSHNQARKWGKKTLDVVVWEYADGLPAPNPRKMR